MLKRISLICWKTFCKENSILYRIANSYKKQLLKGFILADYFFLKKKNKLDSLHSVGGGFF